jgi:hypothetical protein
MSHPAKESLLENQKCADCHKSPPQYANIEFSVFICTHCATVHRRIITNPSLLCPVTNEVLQIFACNHFANRFWECTLPPHSQISFTTDLISLESFIHNKYVEKIWTATSRHPIPSYSLPNEPFSFDISWCRQSMDPGTWI